MKMTIKWHQECAENMASHYSKELDIALGRVESAKEGLSQAAFYKCQINEAIRAGRDGFDRERFMVKKAMK